MNWFEADHFCQILKSHLVEIDSSDENEAITEELKARRVEHQNTPAEFHEFWLGLTDFKTEGRWVLMSSGLDANYTNWDKPSEPSDHSGEENCAHISMARWQWNDRPCEDTHQNNRYTFHPLCEMETTTETPASESESESESDSDDQSEETHGKICMYLKYFSCFVCERNYSLLFKPITYIHPQDCWLLVA